MNLTTEQFAAVSRMFSSTVIRELARTGRSPLLARLLKQSQLADRLGPIASVEHLFEMAFHLLRGEGCRHEYIYKAALTRRILLGRHTLSSASMLTEFRVGDCKADLAILNGTSTVYEIKSERDSLSRLSRQIAEYTTVFASVNVICSSVHVDEVFRAVPSFVGILQLSGRHNISTVREAVSLPGRTSPSAIFDSIRISEAKSILEKYGITLPTVPNTQMSAALKERFIELSPEEAHSGMVRVLKDSRNLLPLAQLINQLPPSLHSAALSTPLRKLDHDRLVGAVRTRLLDAMAWG